MKTTLGPLEARVLAYSQMRGMRLVRTGELVQPLHISPRQELVVLSRLSQAGMVARVRRGLYLLPPRLPLGGAWSPSETEALNTLLEDRDGRYQICGPNAFNRYGFDSQVPARVYAYNNRLSGDRRIGAVCLTLIKVSDERLGAIEKVRTADGLVAVYSSRVRTLVDAVYDWSRFDSLPRAYEWIDRELTRGGVDAADLVKVTVRFGNQGTIRRIGVLLDRRGVSPRILARLERLLNRSTSPVAWIPTLPRRGSIDSRWGVVING